MPLYDDRFRKLIATNIACGASTVEIVDALKVSKWTVNNYRRNIDAFGVPVPPPSATPHRPTKIHVATEEAMVDLLKANPQMYLDEIQDWLANEWDIDVSVPTVQRCVMRLNCTRRRTERINPDQDPQLRALWLYKIASQYSAN